MKALSIPVYFKNGRPSFFPPFSIKKPQPITPYGALSSKYFDVSPAVSYIYISAIHNMHIWAGTEM